MNDATHIIDQAHPTTGGTPEAITRVGQVMSRMRLMMRKKMTMVRLR